MIATLGDQDAGQRGLYVDFFGRPASTHKAIALLALEHNAPLVVLGIPRVAEPLFHHLCVSAVVDPADYAGRPDAVTAMTAALHRRAAGGGSSAGTRSSISGCIAAGSTSPRARAARVAR
ncbi:MAG: hypothetical protein U0736_17460 [Gemmataceae bacterium]